MPQPLFAVTPPGVEEIAAAELRGLGAAKTEVTMGGVEFEGGLEDLYRANLELRCATRVLLRIGSFPARGFDPLRRRAARLPWERFLAEGDALALRVRCRKSRLYHSGAVAQRLREAIALRLGFEPALARDADDERDLSEPPAAGAARCQLVLARIDHDLCTLSVDASGEPLHRRGHREITGKAPLRETLAAALLLESGWDARSPLLDPFCGAGTIAIEAALLARRCAPGRARRFAFEGWRDFDAARWRALCDAADARSARAPQPPAIAASDRDAGAIAATRANARRAGVESDLEISQRAISALSPPEGSGWIVTNPPHGRRLSRGGDLRDLYARLGRVLRARCPGWHVALLAPGARLVRAAELPLEPRRELLHGGLRLTLFCGRVPERA
jgi:putative N6-adenine-specific DNA methylase